MQHVHTCSPCKYDTLPLCVATLATNVCMLTSLTNSVVHTVRETIRAQLLIAAAINGLHALSSGKEIHKFTQCYTKGNSWDWRRYPQSCSQRKGNTIQTTDYGQWDCWEASLAQWNHCKLLYSRKSQNCSLRCYRASRQNVMLERHFSMEL